jgi:hypothetical protein
MAQERFQIKSERMIVQESHRGSPREGSLAIRPTVRGALQRWVSFKPALTAAIGPNPAAGPAVECEFTKDDVRCSDGNATMGFGD